MPEKANMIKGAVAAKARKNVYQSDRLIGVK